MKKKIIAIVVFLICIVLYGARVYYVNSSHEPIIIKEYPFGTKVPYGTDYNHTSRDSIDGYFIEILDTGLYDKEEFIKEFNISSQVLDMTKCFYVVDVRFYNENKETSTESGIFLLFHSLITSSDYYMPDDDLTLEVNPDLPQVYFALRHESSMDVKIVYCLNEPHFRNKQQALKKDFKLLITQYPTRKILKLS